ncbi:MAG: GGDEF domain-containing protein, partial [Exiguobacterium sp.]|nr:GGDEF domain-containing protein [Exiguobacterium sp.]
ERAQEAKGTLSAVKEQRGKYSHILAVSKRTASELEAIYDDYADGGQDEVITKKIEQWLEKLPD